MRRLRRDNVYLGQRVGQARFAWPGLFAIALALGGCATPLATDTQASRPIVTADRADAVANRPAPVQSEGPIIRTYSSSDATPISGFLLGLLGAPRMSSAEEEALIARAIAEHEMRKP